MAGSAAAVDLVGAQGARLRWGASSGTVAGYTVYVSENGGDPAAVEMVPSTTVDLEGFAYGEEIEVSVRAMGPGASGDYVMSEFSPSSETIRFVAPPRLDGHGAMLLRCAACPAVQFRSVENGEILGESAGLDDSWTLGTSADLDGDGTDDVVWHDSEAGVLVVQLVRNEATVGQASASTPALRDLQVIGFGDFDDDRVDEIVLGAPDSGLAIVWGLRGGEVVLLGSLQGPQGGSVVGVADFDGNGTDDLLWTGGTAAAEPAPPPAPPTPAPAISGPFAILFRLYAPLLERLFGAGIFGSLVGGDTTGDVAASAAPVATLEVTLVSGFQVAGRVTVGPEVPADWSLEGSGDYDGDGNADILWRDSRDGALVFWYLDRGAFDAQVELSPQSGDRGLQVMASYDFVNGGGEEVALQAGDTGRIVLVRPDGGSRIVFADPGRQWSAVGVAD